MQIITKSSITKCWKAYSTVKNSLGVWEARISQLNCSTFQELRDTIGNADYISNGNFSHLTIFNIKGNDFRLVVDINFATQRVFLKWFGTHAEYDKIDWNNYQYREFELC
jgi:mRNA interferase HigB